MQTAITGSVTVYPQVMSGMNQMTAVKDKDSSEINPYHLTFGMHFETNDLNSLSMEEDEKAQDT